MQGQELVLQGGNRTTSLTLRDVAIMTFRHRKTAVTCFLAIFLGTILFAVIWPRYKAESELLITRERVDPVVSPTQTTNLITTSAITEEELNSEVELIRSRDVLAQVVKEVVLDRHPSLFSWIDRSTQKQKTEEAIDKLRSGLQIDPLPKTNVIRLSYSALKPSMAFRVLDAIDRVYMQKHKEVHRPAGQYEFFQRESDQAKARLDAAEAQLKAFPQKTGSANPVLARDITIQKVNEFNVSLGQTRAAIAETNQRIKTLEQLATTTPQRLTTQERQADDAPVLQNMKNTLLSLQLKRSDLVSKFRSDYPPIQELDGEIAHTQAAIDAEKQLKDVTTDQNPAHEWIDSELVKAKAELRGHEARAAETENIIRNTLADARALDAQGIEQQDLLRNVKSAEENYLLLLRKREEAKITDALDASHILNVAVAESPTLPTLPAHSTLLYAVLGLALATTVSSGLVFALEYLDPSFRTPDEVERILDLPVLGTLPYQLDATSYVNGNGNHKGMVKGRGAGVDLTGDPCAEQRPAD